VPATVASTAKPPGSLAARWSLFFGLAAPSLAVGGAYLASRELADPFIAFRIFGLALPVGVLGLLIGWIGLLRARGERNPRAKRASFAGSIFSVLTLSGVVGLGLPSAGFPLINDITTDLADPPQFLKIAQLEANRGRDMSYPQSFAEQQRAGYPNLEGRVLAVAPEQAIDRARAALESLPGTEVIDVDFAAGRLEATSVSRVFRFVDDIVVRVRPEGSGSKIDMRSKSRVGKGDLGANAARIESFMLALR
jgi:uncharacterized protein (DUF1499 family)